MANFSGSINLLGYKGARLFTNLDEQHPQMVFVCIPVPYNDIEVSRDGRYANSRVYMQETNDKFRQACIARRQQSGDDMTDYTPPSHQMEAFFSKDFREKAMESAKKRILGEHPEWTGELADPDKNKDLKNAIYDAVRVQLGKLYYQQPRQQQGYQQNTYGQAAQKPAAATQFDGQDGMYEDDLPF